MTRTASAAAASAARTAPELAVLLLELASIVKARTLLPPGDPKLTAAFERCLRTWRGDLARSGPLALEIDADGFREEGGRGLLKHDRLAEILRELQLRQLRVLRFDLEMDGDALAGFAHLLTDPSARDLRGEAFVAQLRTWVPIGIAVEAEAPAVAKPPVAPVAAAPRAAAPAPKLSDPDSDTEPLGAERTLSPLDEMLNELDECASPSSYIDGMRRAVTEAERARDAEVMFRVIGVLAEHVETKEPRLSECARSFLTPLALGSAMSDLLERAARGSGAEQVRAAQILALVGEPAAAAVLDRMPAYPEPIQRERIIPLLLALGERAAPELLGRLDRPDAAIARGAAHVLGMLQHPAAVPRLSELAVGADPLLREEAARALVRIGSEDAVAGLARGLRGERGVVISSVQHLAGTASPKAVAPLGHALERALEAKDVELAKEIVRALGRLGRPEANVIFGSLMHRKAGITGRWLKDVKVAAATALSSVPGDQAVALLAEALRSRDEPLRKAAQRALDRRAEAVSRSAHR
jgi:HEAT repeat protein